MVTKFNIFDEEKLYKPHEIKKMWGISQGLWNDIKLNIDHTVLNPGAKRNKRRLYLGTDLNKYMRMNSNV
tara:strand:+ start:152 stop:361 length:210 start_codon:yes stop_codon:yes gene_type:complete